ncbi:hypothetical protein R8Z50_19140 [Longispora sp. K20-0274]|uniref:hypothetical protein n=1 Tax=Longispora sp. K20-0274 TaxID=3088255 RepID=UPI00399C454A
MEDVVHVLPTGEQNTEDLAEAIRKVAAEQGVAEQVTIEHVGDHDVVIAPRSVVMPDAMSRQFPPKNSQYAPVGIVELVDQGSIDNAPVVMIDDSSPNPRWQMR